MLSDLDAGLNPADRAVFNPLLGSFQTAVKNQTAGSAWVYPLPAAASGPGRVLLLEAYETTSYPDGGDELLGRGCGTFDNSGADAGTVGVEVDGP